MQQPVPGNGGDLLRSTPGLGEHGHRRSTKAMEMEIDEFSRIRRLLLCMAEGVGLPGLTARHSENLSRIPRVSSMRRSARVQGMMIRRAGFPSRRALPCLKVIANPS